MAAAGARDIQAHAMPSPLAAAAAVAAMSVAVAIVATGVAVARGCARPHHVPRGTADIVVVLAVRVVVRAMAVVWVVVAGGAVGHGLEGHGVVELERVGGRHGSAAADRVHQTVKRRAPRRWEGRGGGWPRGSAVRGRKDATTSLSTASVSMGAQNRSTLTGARLTLIIQLETWLMLREVAWQSCFFSSSLG